MRPLRLFSSVGFWWILCLLWAGLLAWNSRFAMNPDGVSYLDMASNTVSGSPAALLNSYWSPGFPALVAALFAVTHPPRVLEFPLVHLLNYAVFVVALSCFTFFLRTWAPPREERTSFITPLGFGLFLWFTTEFTTLRDVSPDLLLAAFVFLVAALACRLARPHGNWRHGVALGLTLAIGYYAKTVFLPLGLVLLALNFVASRSIAYGRRNVLYATAALLGAAAPLVIGLSCHTGRFTIGETGRLNYLWYANRRELGNYLGWTGGFGDAYAALAHPPRKLLDSPVTFEYAAPVAGTYPLWFDPAYWWTGASPRFELRAQLAAVRENLNVYAAAFRLTSGLVLGVLLILFFPSRRNRCYPESPNHWWLLAWPLAACSGYALIHIEFRFIGPFLVLFWLGVYRLLLPRIEAGARAAIVAAILLTLFVPSSLVLRSEWSPTNPPDQTLMARALHEAGVEAGDRLALVGPGFTAYYAHCAGVRIVAEVSDPAAFWRLDAEHRAAVIDALASTGAKALAAVDRPDQALAAGWHDTTISGSRRFSVLALQRPLMSQTLSRAPRQH